MNTIDLKLFTLDSDGLVSFSFSNIGERAVGSNKLIQKYLRYFYGNDCGGVLNIYRSYGVSSSTIETVRNAIVSAVIKANEKIKTIQDKQDLHPDETFVDCELKKLDIDVQDNQVNVELNLITESGSTVVIT